VNSDLWAVLSLEQGLASLVVTAVNCVCVLQSLLEGVDEVNSDLWAVLSLEQGLASLAVNCVCVTVIAGRSG